jgi:glycerol-3-phosphate acyltransferase PlsY
VNRDIVQIALLVLCYLIGSIPPAVWISKYIYGKDIRTQGSGNAGSTNMYRIYGRGPGIATQVIDLVKGSVAASIPLLYNLVMMDDGADYHRPWLTVELQCLLCGVLAVMGHVWPIFAGFKGGKGVNTLLGMMLVVNWQAALICLAVFLIVFLLTHFVSAGSLLGTLTYPVFIALSAFLSGDKIPLYLFALGVLMFLLVAYTHRTNIKRLLSGSENKMYLLKSKK